MKFQQALLLTALLSVQTTRAATITVTSTADSGPGTLRAALASAAHGDTIDATGLSGAILLTSGELLVNRSVTITGPGNLAVDGNAASRVFHIAPSNTVTIANMIITHGKAPFDRGGGIYNENATLTLTNCLVSGNSGIPGGGIYNNGEGIFGGGSASLTIVNSTLSGNSAFCIFNDGCCGGAARVEIVASTLYANSGGINNYGNSGSTRVKIVNGTLSANSGWAIQNNGTVDIVNSTLNGAGGQGGIYNSAGTVNIGSSILSFGIYGVDLYGAVTSLGYNLSSGAGWGSLSATGDQIYTDPLLGPLRDNGGPALTHALARCSPAIDQGKNFSASATDQRGVGFVRTVHQTAVPNPTGGDGTDTGALEFQETIANPNPPVARCRNVTVSANESYCAAYASVDDGSFDPDGDPVTLVQTPPGQYPLGTTTVTLTVTDCHRASSQCTATVTVVDTTPPFITSPQGYDPCGVSVEVNATSPAGAVVRFADVLGFEPTARDNCSATLTCTPPSGSTFAIGTTTVNCRAIDGSGNTTTCAFTVEVKGPAEQINDLTAAVQALAIDSGVKNGLLVKLQDALSGVNANNKPKACSALQDFISLCNAQVAKRKLDAATASFLVGEATRIRAVIGCK